MKVEVHNFMVSAVRCAPGQAGDVLKACQLRCHQRKLAPGGALAFDQPTLSALPTDLQARGD